MELKKLKSSAMLLTSSLIWGLAFVVQSSGMEYIGAFTFSFVRSLVGAAALLPLAILNREKSKSPKTLLFAGIACGTALGVATNLQQYGLLYTTVGKAGFITAMYIIMIPLAGLFMGRKCTGITAIAVVLAAVGVYLLCINGTFSVNKGDFYEFLCAVAFTVQILLVSRFSPLVNAYKLSCIEFFTAAAVSAVPMLLTEQVDFTSICMSWKPLLYMGILSSGVGYTLQILGQRNLNPTVAAIIMSLESCISVIGGWLILNQSLSAREIAGCIIMFAAIIIIQLPPVNTAQNEKSR